MTQYHNQLLSDLSTIFAENDCRPNKFQHAISGEIHDGIVIDKHLHYSALIPNGINYSTKRAYWEYLYKVHDRCVEEIAKPLALLADTGQDETFYSFPPKADGATTYVQWGIFFIRVTVRYDMRHLQDKLSFDILYGVGTNKPEQL